jgi:hypothetical protein
VRPRAVGPRCHETGTMRRLLLCAALVLGFTTAPAVVATPIASADGGDCKLYLMLKFYSGLIIDIACGYGEDGDIETCQGLLDWEGVKPYEVVKEACWLASQP